MSDDGCLQSSLLMRTAFKPLTAHVVLFSVISEVW